MQPKFRTMLAMSLFSALLPVAVWANPMAKSPGICPEGAQAACFTEEYPCGLCCKNHMIPIGNLTCWEGDVNFATCCGLTAWRMAHFEQGKRNGDPAAINSWGTFDEVGSISARNLVVK